MAKGIIYIMEAANTKGIIKIGKTENNNYKKRMSLLGQNGYCCVPLDKYFAVEIDNYDEIEKLMDRIFAKVRIGKSELFAADKELAREILIAMKGKQIYPTLEDKTITKRETTSLPKMSWLMKQGIIKKGDKVYITNKPKEKAIVIDSNTVKYKGEVMSFNDFGKKITGWKAIQIYTCMKIEGNDKTLDELRRKALNKK